MFNESVEGFPVSPQQEHLWQIQKTGAVGPYRAESVWRIEGRLDVAVLESALNEVIRRHEILRTAFVGFQGLQLPLQVITAPRALAPRRCGPGDLEAGTESLDLERGEVLSASLATRSPDEHLLALGLPGLCADAATLDNLMREIAELYRGQAAGLSEEPVQYADVAQFFRQILDSGEAEAGKEHWRRHIARGSPRAMLPLEKSRTGEEPFAPGAIERSLGADIAGRAAAVAHRSKVGVEAFFFACWQVLLRRLTERPNLTVAAAVDGRGHEGLKDALGLFARHLPVPIAAAEEAPFTQFIEQAHNSLLTAQRWQEAFSWTLAGDFSGEEPDRLYWPFCFELREPLGGFTMAGLRFSSLTTEACWDRFKLKLVVLRRDDGLTARFEYDSGCLAGMQVDRLASAFEALLRACLEHPETRASELPIVGTDEWRQLVFDCNDTRVEHRPGERLHDPFEAQAERTPEAVAVVSGERRMTYRELDRRADRLAHRLRASGVGPESIVAIHLERSFAMVESILAVLKAGGAYLPLDPDYPRERLAFILKDAEASVLVTEESLGSGLPAEATAGVVILYAGEDTEPAETGIFPPREATAENTAYLIYTSGSTGRPKGVVVPHRAIVNRLRWMQREFPLTPADRVLQKTPYGFDASIWELFSPLWAGARLVLAEPGAHRDSARMVELIIAHGVTRLQLVPSLLRVFLDEPRLGECSSLKHLFCGGEALMSEWRERVFERLDCRLTNLYGPTEAAIDASFHPCLRWAGEGIEPIGRPLDNVRIYLLGPGMQCVATGMAGHLHIGGAGLARGYQGRPDVTAERFLPDFLSGVPGGRLYATGDLARRREDGTIQYLGRIDQQVKVHGVRIELGEIEAVLSEHPGVEEAVVVAQTGESGALRLAAYIVPPRKRSPDPVETLTLPDGLEVAYLNRNETQAIHREIFVDRTYLQHGIELPDGAVVVDAGANIGLFTLFVHQSCEKPRVFAFEPIPPTFARLRRNVELYGLEVELFNCGLGSHAGTATFSFYRNWSGMSGIHADREEDEAMTRALLHNQDRVLAENAGELLEGRFEIDLFSCQMTTLSDVISCHGIEQIDLLKVDVEKSELAVLAGIAESDWGKIRQIVLEAHDRDGHLAALTGLLRNHGFEFVVEQDAWLTGTNLYNIYAVRREAGGLARKREPGSPRRLEIIAARAPSAGELRDVLRAKLPEPMVPAHIVFLDALPRMANGKVDRRALPVPSPSGASDRPEVEPRTPAETLLAGIWSGLLGKEKVSIEDNFFELGGDSILAIQLVSRAKAAGLELNARQVFSHQTIARLAAVAGSRTAVTASPSEVDGPIPLTPAQSWFFAQDLTDSHHFNQAVLLSVHRPLDAGLLARAVRTLVARHDALRLRFERDGQAWIQRLLGADEVDAPLASVDLSRLPAGLYPTAIESVAESVAPSLDLSRGPLLRVVHFDLGPSEPGRLLIVIHHLAVDGVSWRILLEDLETVCERLESGRALVLARATTSFAAWAQRLDEYARTMPLEPELAWWRGECAGLPAADREARAPEVVALRNVSFDLSTRETQALLHEIHAAYRTQINEVLLTALAGALLDRGLAPVIELEGHGREDLVEGVDLSRTVGWFTTLFPVRLELQPFWGPDESIKAVKEHLRAIPRRGIGYGLLRYLRAGEPAVQTLRDLAPPEVCFNYLGQLDQALPPGSRFSAASEGSGPAQSRRTRRSNPIDVNALVLGGCLRVTFHFDAHVRQLSAVQPLAERFHERLLALVAHCRTRIEQRVASYTPEDFPLAGLDQRELDRHLGTEWGIEDVYPLTPLQEGIFFHSLLAPGTGVYVGQLTCTLPADLDSRRFRQAWERLIERHGTLRTAFLWEGLDEPRQAVRKSCALPWQDLDWRGLPADEQQRRFEELRHRDRQASLPLNEAPLMRFFLVRLDREPGFIWTFHHLLMDGWSLPLLVQELGAIYMALAEGREPGLSPAWPFSDYIAWLRRQDPSRLEPFWREELAGFAAPNSLGIVHPAKTEGASGYAEHRIQVSRELTERLKALAAGQKLTLQTITLGAWALLISRYSGEEDVVFGSVVSGRPAALPGVEAMVGIFINTLPVRVRVNGAELLAPWLQHLQERQLARQEFEHSPLARIQGWSEISAGSPLFETLYAFQNYPTPGEGDSGGLRVGNVRNVEHTNYPITLVLTAVDRISLQLTSDRARVDGDAALRLLQHLATLLAGMAEELERRLGELGLLSPSERHQAIAEWNDTGVWPAREDLFLDLLAARAEQNPELPAVTQGREQLSHGELAARSERLVAHLRTLGVGPDILVALFLERSIDLVVALLAVLKAGGAYLPLDPSLPRPRLSFLLDDARPSLVLTRTRRLPDLTERSSGVVCLDDLPHGAITAGPVARPAADNLAYVLYTSGSTGHPKGVAVTHRGLANYLLWAAEAYPAGEGRGAPVHSPVSFDLTVTGLFLPLLAGRCVHLVPEEEGIEGLAAALAQGGFGLVKLTPAHLEVLERLLPPERVAGSARAFVIGGEALSGEQLAFWRAHAPSLRLINEYGPTETVVGCSTYEVPTSVSPTGPVPIGRPIANTRILILDPWLHPVPIGVPGELYLGGAGMCRGYLDRPGLTAEMLVPDPFGTWGERLYRTGDLARRLPDGQIEFLGRSDHQVKIRGFRIELGEIEAVLLALPGVRQAVVTVRDQRLVAYVVGDITVEELRRPLFERLPDYMVPAAFVTLAALPLTPNGKVDREALPAPESQRRSQARRRSRHRARTAASYLAPRTPVEEILAGLWAEILGHERVGAADHFFDLGGHSLLATRVISRLRGAFGVEIPMRDLFAAPVLADFAARIETARRSGTVPPAPPLVPVPREGLLPLSFAQQRLWFIDQLEPGSPLYNVAATLRAEGPLEAGVLARSLGEIVRRHEALRTVFTMKEGAPVQRIQPPMPCALPVVDLSGLPEGRRETVALSLAQEEAARPFDLARGPLLRGVLLRLAGEDHVAALAMHHIVSDGWSMGILIREITALYEAFSEGEPSPLSELPVQYADFAVWQRSWLCGEILENEISYWRRQLAGLPPLLNLPTDRPRPALQSFRGSSRPVRLPAELSQQIESLSRREGATLFMVLLAGFQTLLARYSGQDDIAVGSPVAGRNRVETEGQVGFFVNTLVLRGDLSGAPTFRELLGRVRETALAAYLHQDVPFEKLVEELAPERSLARAPLFQVMFALQNAPVESLEIRNLHLRPFGVDGTTAKFDLTVSFAEQDGGWSGTVQYATDLFEATTIDRWIGHFERLLARVAASPEQSLLDLPLLGGIERQQALREWAGALASGPPGSLIHELFAAQAARSPLSVALVCGEARVTYADLDARADRMAAALHELGVGPEVPVGLCAERSVEMIVALLGILKAGGSYVPLDPESPRERLRLLLEEAGVTVVLAGRSMADRLPQPTALVVDLDGEPQVSGGSLTARGSMGSESLAYVMYTSGSTGRPKGVGVCHRGVVRLCRESGFARFDEREVFLQAAPLSFDASTLEIWACLLNGGRLVLPPSGALSLEQLGRIVREEGVTTLWLTAGLFHLMVDERLQDLAGVRQLLAGGDVLSVPHVARVLAELPACRVINGYGPTENTTFTCCHRVGKEISGSVPIGRPIRATYIYIVDRELAPVPVGVAGELLTGGAGLARGYLNRPDLTAERFIPDPYGGEPGERLYRTGDLCRYRLDGSVEFLGRTDHQVKIRGFRIEPGEIEAALVALPGVREAVVLALEDRSDRRLVAYVVGDAAVDTLRQGLRERLPEFMVPAAFVPLAALPLTPNGKVDRKALPTPEWQSTEESYVAPRTPVEDVLAGIWAELLGLERAGATDSFFNLGGHSLMATRVLSRLREAFDIEVPLRDLFEAPVLADLAARVEAALRARAGRLTPPLVPVPREVSLPLSFAQQRLWFIDQLEPGSPLYNIPVALRTEGPLDAGALARSLGEIVRRHEALRTVFAVQEGAPVQRTQPPRPCALPVVDLSGLPESRREAAAFSLAGSEASRPFDLARGPLLRSLLLRMAEEDHIFALTLHHIVSDGWSMGILVREITALYAAFSEGESSPLPDLPVQYADFAAWQRSWLRGEILENEIAYWRRQLAGLPPRLELPTDRPRPAAQSFRGVSRPVRLPADLTRRVQALGRREGATLFMVLLAGFQALLARYSGQDDLAVGTPVAGRNRIETEGLIGFFVNTLVLRGDLSGPPTVRELLGRVRETALAAYLHQDVPFEKLVEELAPERSLAHSPLFQVMFALQNTSQENLEMKGLWLRPVSGVGRAAKFDLTLALEERDSELTGTVEHATDLFDSTTINRLILQFERLLAGMAEGMELRLGELDLLSPAEHHQAIVEWNDTGVSRAQESLLELLAARTEQNRERSAVTHGGEQLSFGELDARSERLAAHLRTLGVGPDVLASVFLERSIDLVVALFAVWKAGGAYLPLDPTLPSPRLSFLLSDARPPLVLTRTRLLPDLPEHSSGVVCLDDLPEGADTTGPAARPAADNLAYVLYTSGSTGHPKGVAVTHRGLANYLLWAVEAYPAVEGRGAPVHSPISFDLTVTSLFLPLLAGRCVHLVPENEGVEGLAAALTEGGFGLVKLTPAHLEILSRIVSPERAAGSAAAFVIGGESLSGEHLSFWSTHAPGLRLFNEYGPTETVVGCCVWEIPTSARPTGPVPIGRPIANGRIQIVDSLLHPLPIGVAGELCIGGDGVCRGYLHRPDLTAERFVPDPFGARGERLYRSGDLARHLADGTIEYLGRIDHQVKVRGFRIELGEIEAALACHPQVLECAVLLREDRPGDQRLVAYIVPVGSATVASAELRAFLRHSLPEFMVPATFVNLTSMPISPNGKVDRRALPQPVDGSERKGDYLAPRTPIEELLAGIWSDLLRVEKVGGNDDFFELGGHSLQGIRLVARIREVLGVDLPVRTLFQAPTLAALAASIADEMLRRAEQRNDALYIATGQELAGDRLVSVIAQLQEQQLSIGMTRIRPVEKREGPLPLSFAQERLWFLEQLKPGTAFYNIPGTVRIEGELRFEVLVASLEEVTRRHESLRTTFGELAGQPYQRVGPDSRLTVPIVDLTALPPAGRESELRQLATDESRRPFDLARGPLMRVVLFRLGTGDQVIVYTTHHIISDGWSALIFLREMAALYAALSTGRPASLPSLPVQYVDYAAWQRTYLAGSVLETQLSYWRDRLAGVPGLELPTDRPRPAIESFRGGSHTVRLPQETGHALLALSRREGATLFMTLLALFKTLLLRHSGQTDLAVGSPIANRNRSEVEGVIGFFANTVVLRTDLHGDPSFRELLMRVREVALGAYAHEDLPFERIVEELQPERDMSRNPLFQVMCVLQNQPQESLPAGDLRMSPLSIELGIAKFDLTLFWYEEQGRISGLLEYNTDLFDRSTALRFYQHYERLLEAVLADPGRSLLTLPLLSDAERHQIAREWSDTVVPLEPVAVHEQVGMQSARTPERRAIVWPGGSWTYAELNARADRLANHLLSIGILPGDPVGVFMERGPELGVAVLAALKAGGAYLPIDPNYPQERLDFLIDDSGVRMLLIQERLLPAVAGRPVRAVLVDEVSAGVEGGAPVAPQVPIEEGWPAYVIYTSGSTGRPKGIVLPHRTLSNLVSWQIATFPRTAAAATLQLASPSFDVSLQEMFTTWCAGGTLIIAPEEARRDSERLARYLAEQSVERLFAPFVVLQQLAEYLTGEEGRELPVSLREVVTAGERLQITPQLATLFSRLSGCPLRNQYGPSESHVVTERVLDDDPTAWPFLPSIGRPIANTETFLLDHWLQTAAIGVPGELAIGGAGLALGYWDRPSLTAEKFIPDPFSRTPGARLYRTGDLARWRSDGELEFLGRIDHQVKVRGFRIELGEIEAVLGEIAGVREAVVVAREALPTNQQLVAYVVGEVAAETLRETLRDRLPEYMVPSAFVMLEALPLTPNGKVDRQCLPAPQQGPPEGHLASRTPMEEVLEGIWAETLGVERVGVKESFFAIGGHSLLATRVISRVRHVFGVELPLRALFEEPTVAGLAARIEAALRGGVAAASPIMPVPQTGPLPLSFAQQRLWLIDQLEPDSPLYNLSMALWASGPLDTMALACSLGEIVRRHEALRTVFTAVDGEPVQVVQPTGPFLLPVVDLSALPETPREALALALTAEEARRPFDLSQGPLFRASLLRMGPEDHMALVTIHHIASDGWSMGILVREITALYPSFAEGRPSPLPELPVQYADFAVWQRSWLYGEVLENEISFWRRQLAELPPVLDFPADHPRPALQSFRGSSRLVRLPAGLTHQVEALGRREGATLFMVLLAGFQALLARYSGQDDFAVGSPVAGRNRIETEGLIGFFVNTLVLRSDLAGAPTFRELLGRVRETTLSAYLHQDVPFEKVVEELAPERSLAHAPLFQVMFVLQNFPVESLEIRDLRLRPVGGAIRTAKFDLTLSLEERGGELAGTFEHATDLYDATTIDRLTAHFERLLTAAVATPDLSASVLPLLSPAECGQILREWNDTRTEGLAEGCLHHDVFAQAARTPLAVAIELGAERWTYRRLTSSARSLARHLRELGVGPDAIVGLCAERSPAMVVGMLGVLEAGGAYLPLDPTYPPERLEFMLDDSGAQVLLIQEHLLARVPAAVRRVVLLDAHWDSDEETGEALGVEVSPDNLAYIIYTSGSTGRPKGVMVPHRGVVNRLRWAQQIYQLGPSDAVLQKASFSFDFSVWECFAPLSAGARLVLAEPDRQGDGAYLVRTLREHRVTFVHFVPSMLAAFLDEEGIETCVSLRQIFSGGEALTPELRDRVLARHPAPLDNQYGPTEISIDTTRWVCAPGQDPHRVPIGRPIANSRLYVVDPELRPLPIDVTGELLVGGLGVTRGYMRMPALTAKRFVPDPFAVEPGARLYRTGDLVRWTQAGHLEFLGRIDHQVKIRGLRIELGDVEAALSAIPGVRQVVVMPREGRLVAWVAGNLDADRLRRELRERLPEAMVPNTFVILAELPVTPTGKVDRKALPPPQPLAAVSGYAAPRTREEQILAEIWAQTLRVPRVGRNDNFFELGGDSILSVQIVARARQAGLSFTMRQLFEHQTVAALARHAVLETAGTVRAEQGPVVGEVPLTPIQRWFFEQGFADPQHFNQALLLEAREPLSPAALERATAAIVEHHDALRLRFASRAGDWRQENAPAEPAVPFHLVDLSALPAPRRVQALAPAAAALQAGFNLSAGPLTRLCLFEAGAGLPSQLLWVSHHLVVDGVSWRVLLEDLERAYRQAARGQRPGFPPKTTSFQEWARRLAAHAGSDVVADEREHWREIAGVPVPRLPVDFPSGGNLVGDEATVSFELSTEETADLLQTLPSVYHNRIDDALLSSLGRALAGWIGYSQLRLDLEGHGREPLFDDLDLSRTVGWFTSLYPVVLEAGDAGPDAALVSAKNRLRAVPGRGLGHGLLRHLGKTHFLEEAPSAEILFNYLGQVDGTLDQLSLFRVSTASAGPGRSPRAHRAYLLAIDGIVTEGRLRMTLTYGSRVHRRETMERLAAAYADTLRQLIQHGRGSREVFMASGLEEEGRLLWSPLVPIQPLGDRAPLFCIHALGGEVLYYYRLARELGADQPLYGLQARPMDGMAGQSAAPQITIEELAAEYLNAVRSCQPVGPYFLAGHSFGGVVAFEMARQLTASGEDVALLAVLDQPVSASDEAAEVDTAAVIGDLVRHLARGQGRTVELDADALRGLSIDHQLERGLEVLGGMEALGPGFDIPMLRGLALGWSSRTTAVERYKISAYPGRIILLRARDIDLAFLRELSPERRRIFEDPTLGWGAVAAEGVEVHSVPGNHQTILEAPHVETLAGILRACIEREDERPEPTARTTRAAARPWRVVATRARRSLDKSV
jgi:amino acid adenylation domain-containing protein/non-ribosomal peptide synthase protein (TIGR01720 family)/FkbM family methyltransferase